MKKGPPNRKQAARLARRLADYAILINSKNPESGAKEQRKASGGYRRPGSMQ